MRYWARWRCTRQHHQRQLRRTASKQSAGLRWTPTTGALTPATSSTWRKTTAKCVSRIHILCYCCLSGDASLDDTLGFNASVHVHSTDVILTQRASGAKKGVLPVNTSVDAPYPLFAFVTSLLHAPLLCHLLRTVRYSLHDLHVYYTPTQRLLSFSRKWFHSEHESDERSIQTLTLTLTYHE